MKTELALLLHYEKPTLSAAEVAELLEITERSLENQIYEQRCPFPMFKMGSKWAAHISDVAAYIDRQRDEARNSPRFAGGSGVATIGRKAA